MVAGAIICIGFSLILAHIKLAALERDIRELRKLVEKAIGRRT